MFTRAGYNIRGAHRWTIWAYVEVVGGRRRGWAQIVQFASGDLAWYSAKSQFLIWGLRGHVFGHMEATFDQRYTYPRSRLP